LKRGDKAGARKAFEAAKAENPDDVNVRKQLGYIYLGEKNAESASAEFEAARNLSPGDAQIALQLGYIYQGQGKGEQAKDAFTSAAGSPDEKIRAAAEAALRMAPHSTEASVPTEPPAVQ